VGTSAIFSIVSGLVIGRPQHPGSPRAQMVQPLRLGTRAAGFHVAPPLSVAETCDDSLFLTSPRQQDDAGQSSPCAGPRAVGSGSIDGSRC